MKSHKRFSINKYAYFYNYIENNEKYEQTYLNLIRNETRIELCLYIIILDSSNAFLFFFQVFLPIFHFLHSHLQLHRIKFNQLHFSIFLQMLIFPFVHNHL